MWEPVDTDWNNAGSPGKACYAQTLLTRNIIYYRVSSLEIKRQDILSGHCSSNGSIQQVMFKWSSWTLGLLTLCN